MCIMKRARCWDSFIDAPCFNELEVATMWKVDQLQLTQAPRKTSRQEGTRLTRRAIST